MKNHTPPTTDADRNRQIASLADTPADTLARSLRGRLHEVSQRTLVELESLAWAELDRRNAKLASRCLYRVRPLTRVMENLSNEDARRLVETLIQHADAFNNNTPTRKAKP